MELTPIHLVAGVPKTIPVAGKYFRITSGAGKFKIDTDSGIHSDYLAGIGCDLSNPNDGRGFTFVTIESEKTQNCEILISNFPTLDSRLVGELGSGFETNSLTIAAATSEEIFPANLSRKEINISIDQPLYVSGLSPATNSDFYVPVGTHNFKNVGALYGYNDTGIVCNVSILEEVL